MNTIKTPLLFILLLLTVLLPACDGTPDGQPSEPSINVDIEAQCTETLEGHTICVGAK